VFSDFFLEGQMTGGDLLYAIRTQLHYSRQEMPVLVITIEDNKRCQTEIFHAGANDFVTKPVKEEVLIARIKSLLLVKHQYKVIRRYSNDIYNLETIDDLTRVHNKKFLLKQGKNFITQNKNICLMMADIDHFEKIDETQGHLIGDHILHLFGQFLINHFPKETLIARFAGKKFTIVMPCTLEEGKGIAENFRQETMELKPEGFDITISIGLTSAEGQAEATLANLLSNADSALHSAQQNGYNCSCLCTLQKNVTNI
jgi:diguanylate cyclase (GGDEF)-like protein